MTKKTRIKELKKIEKRLKKDYTTNIFYIF